MLEDLEDSVDSVFEPPAASKTSHPALKQLETDLGLIVHPCCPNSDCSHVFYEIRRRDDSDRCSVVPRLCTSLRDFQNCLTVFHFPKRSCNAELEYVFRTPGSGYVFTRRKERKGQCDQEDAEEASRGVHWRKVNREQDDLCSSDHSNTICGVVSSAQSSKLEAVTVSFPFNATQYSRVRICPVRPPDLLHLPFPHFPHFRHLVPRLSRL